MQFYMYVAPFIQEKKRTLQRNYKQFAPPVEIQAKGGPDQQLYYNA